MKLQRVVNLKAYGKTYYRWQIAIPSEAIDELDWKPGEELVPEVVNGELHLRRAQFQRGKG